MILQFTLSILVLLNSFNNYNDEIDENNNRDKKVVTRAYAQTDKNDSGPLVGMNMRGYYTTMPQERQFEFYLPSNYYEQSFKIFSQSGIGFVQVLVLLGVV